MKVLYRILYKNGVEDVREQTGTDEELAKINAVIDQSFKEGVDAVVTLVNGDNEGTFIRLSDVSRVSVQLLDKEES